MKKITKTQIDKYIDKRASCQVLGCLMKDSSLIKLNKYKFNSEDFPLGLHRITYVTIHNLLLTKIENIKIADIETYLHNNNPQYYNMIFDNEKNLEWLNKIIEDANIDNFQYYYDILRKMSLMRSYLSQGIDVSDLLDIDAIDPKIIEEQKEHFNHMSVAEIQRYFDKKNIIAKKNFSIKDKSDYRKSGDDADELWERLQTEPAYGFNLESKYLNTIIRGALNGKFIVETRDTGKGKSRVAIKRLVDICSPYLWDFKNHDFVSNINGQDNAGLYIGTELELLDEIEPMFWSFISGVEEDKIIEQTLNTEEFDRVMKAKEISKKMRIFQENEPNYDLTYLWNTVERYKNEFNIAMVSVDYLELTSGVIAEYAQMVRGLNIREDLVLAALSDNCKQIAKQFDIPFFGYTQTTDEARRDYTVRDQRAVKGSRSLINKADVGITTFEPTQKEMKLIEPIIKKKMGIIKKENMPNLIYNIYKNRGGKIHDVKIWLNQNLGNMYTQDMFCTNKNYNPINIDQKIIRINKEDASYE